MMALVYFIYPRFLLLLFLIPIFVFFYFFSFFYRKRKAILFPNFEAMERLSGMGVLSKNFISLYLNLIIICLIIFSISGTVVSFTSTTSAFAYVIAIDNSGSMKANDFLPDRLSVAKDAAKNFVDLTPLGTETGVISFAGGSEILKKVDSSKIQTKAAIDSIDFSELEGTNIYSTLITASNLLESYRYRAVILMSDGQINIGDISQIIKYAVNNNIVIHTFVIGTEEGGVIEPGAVSKVDEQSLQALAFNTGGKFFRVGSRGELDDSLAGISQTTNKQISLDISIYLELIALALIAVNWVLFNFRFRTIP